jgi:hypothetical protein
MTETNNRRVGRDLNYDKNAIFTQRSIWRPLSYSDSSQESAKVEYNNPSCDLRKC